MNTKKPHEYQIAGTILQGLISNSNCKLPLDRSNAIQAAEYARELVRATKGDVHVALVAARQIVALLGNPISAHCSKRELISYAIHTAVLVHKEVHDEVVPQAQDILQRYGDSPGNGIVAQLPNTVPQMPTNMAFNPPAMPSVMNAPPQGTQPQIAPPLPPLDIPAEFDIGM